MSKKRLSRISLHTWALLIAVLVLVGSATMGAAWAYFTTFAQAKGTKPLKLGHHEEIYESVDGSIKTIRITSTEDSKPTFIRAKAIYATENGAGINMGNSGGADWVYADDGWWYYTKVLPSGKSTSDLKFAVIAPEQEVDAGDSFNVVIVYESIEAQYTVNGQGELVPTIDPRSADWDHKVDAKTGGNS